MTTENAMKIRGSFVTRDIAGDIVIVPVGETALEYNGMITVTRTGAEIWKALETGCDSRDELVRLLLDRFDVDRETAAADVDDFLDQLRKANLLEE